jgi:3'-phosphoadenosine 5'-phosphosulfate sulfotransferase (PAPS reductase)/FAD synthetase
MSIEDKLKESKEIIDRAILEYQPYAIVAMVSGGDDSLTSYYVARILGVQLTHILHGITRTGIPETTEFVERLGEASGLKFLEADAGNMFERSVLRKGFLGRGTRAHTIAYHILKQQHFRKAISKNIRQRKRGRIILHINGARRQESANRSKHTSASAINPHGSDIWINIINEWSKADCQEFLRGAGVERNPVTEALCRSGECFCGTMQSQEARKEAAFFYPKWGEWLDDLECRVNARGFWWKWGQAIPKEFTHLQNGQQWLSEEFQPMCTSCEWRNNIANQGY